MAEKSAGLGVDAEHTGGMRKQQMRRRQIGDDAREGKGGGCRGSLLKTTLHHTVKSLFCSCTFLNDLIDRKVRLT